MKIISWNVNGLRAILKKDFLKFLKENPAEIYCLQEIKIHEKDLTEEILNIGKNEGYKIYFNCAQRKGYSGTAIISKIKPLSLDLKINFKEFDEEGRVMFFETEKFYLINIYVPNSKKNLERIEKRIKFNEKFIEKCEKLRKNKPIIFTGDLNVAHKEIDLTNPKNNKNNAGFTNKERLAFTKQLDKNYLDTFRIFNKNPGNYTWWSYRFNARSRNIGWRLDYFIISSELKSKIKSSKILKNILGSDHCPIILEIK